MKNTKTFDSLPDIRFVQYEEYTKENYFWDNAKRKSESGLVIQQTLSGSVYFKNANGTQYAGKGQAMIFSHGDDSCYGLDGNCALPYTFRWVVLSGGKDITAIAAEICHTFGSVLKMSEKGEAGKLLQHIHNDVQNGNVRDRFYLADCAYRLLTALYREQITDSRGSDPISYGKHLLETQFRSPRNLKEWANEIGVTREHFTREFKTRYGETPATFLRRLRLEHANILLLNHSLTLQDVATASGFASPQTFYRAYKRMYGYSAGHQRI